MLKSYRWGGVGGPCDFSVTPVPWIWDLGIGDWGLDWGLTIFIFCLLVSLLVCRDNILAEEACE